MTSDALANLARIKQLKPETPDQAEFNGLVNSAKIKLKDSRIKNLSEESRFLLTYSAAHALAVAALRWHGYRSDNRYLVFQCSQHTVKLPNTKWRVLDKCHKQRNLAEYQGHLEITPELLKELDKICEEVLKLVAGLGPIAKNNEH